MNLVFFTHPDFLGHKSMPRFARMLSEGMASRGHSIETWSPPSVLSSYSSNPLIKKWLGYFDQYIAFPRHVKNLLKQKSADTLFVFTDQALGPWVPLVADRPHVIHCHDFIALRSALGQMPQNPTGWTGRQYQQLIRNGFSRGNHFISVSEKTKDELHQYLTHNPHSSDVVYNGFHQPFKMHDQASSTETFSKRIGLALPLGYILHVGGNLWYKNRSGVIDIYNAWRKVSKTSVPLLLVGESPTVELIQKQKSSPYAADIHWLENVEDKFVNYAYSGASVFLFPSIEEGFGWPIAEAMASGCPVITTGEAPMSEVAGQAAFLIARKPVDAEKVEAWAQLAAKTLDQVLNLTPTERKVAVENGIENAKRFDTIKALDKIELIYSRIVNESNSNSR